jgi:hypothetical protein
MKHESLEYKMVMDDGKDTEVPARPGHLDLAGPATLPCARARGSSSGTMASRSPNGRAIPT